MSATIYELPPCGLALTPQQMARELRELAEAIERGELDPVRIGLLLEHRATRKVSCGAIGDRTDYAYLFWLMDKAKYAALATGAPAGLYEEPA